VPVPLYQDAPAADMAFVLTNAEIAFAVVEDQEQVDKLRALRAECPALRHIAYDDERGMRHYRADGLRSLAAVQELIFDSHSITPAELISALDTDFLDKEELRLALEQQAPKVGNDDERADGFMVKLFDMLADSCEGYGKTSRGGILRPGSGSAMYYIWLTQGAPGMREPVVGATAEGRHKSQPLAANLAPTQGVQVRGPISVLLSFSKIDYRRICNGGPVTLELSDSVFRDAESVRKVAMLVRAFAQQGCQQLQVNSMNLATLLDSKAHPELHKNLIVRVWGWSGYFCELSPEYQDQVIARHIYASE
jgi:formate C-acetyltransferase